MKQLFITILTTLAMALATGNAVAQENAVAAIGQTTEHMIKVAKNTKGGLPLGPEGVSYCAGKNFAKQFIGATGAVWAKEGKGFSVFFTKNGIKHRVHLNSRGSYQSGIKYYFEKDLPAAIRHQVKSTYYDYAITSVVEVFHNRTTAYLVTVADGTCWKVIRIVNGEADVYEAHEKA